MNETNHVTEAIDRMAEIKANHDSEMAAIPTVDPLAAAQALVAEEDDRQRQRFAMLYDAAVKQTGWMFTAKQAVVADGTTAIGQIVMVRVPKQ